MGSDIDEAFGPVAYMDYVSEVLFWRNKAREMAREARKWRNEAERYKEMLYGPPPKPGDALITMTDGVTYRLPKGLYE